MILKTCENSTRSKSDLVTKMTSSHIILNAWTLVINVFFPEMEVPEFLDVLIHGWFRGNPPFLGNLHVYYNLGGSWNGGTSESSIFDSDFPWKKASSDLGVPPWRARKPHLVPNPHFDRLPTNSFSTSTPPCGSKICAACGQTSVCFDAEPMEIEGLHRESWWCLKVFT